MKKRRKSGSLSKAKKSAKSALRKTGSKLKRATKKTGSKLNAPLRRQPPRLAWLKVQLANREEFLKVSSQRVAAARPRTSKHSAPGCWSRDPGRPLTIAHSRGIEPRNCMWSEPHPFLTEIMIDTASLAGKVSFRASSSRRSSARLEFESSAAALEIWTSGFFREMRMFANVGVGSSLIVSSYRQLG